MPGLLEVRDLAVSYVGSRGAPVAAVEGVSLDVEPGELVGLLGESGCGKTTLLLAILGLLPESARVTRGSIRFRDRDLLAMDASELRRVRGAEIAFVFQDPALALNPVRRVGPQIAEVLRAHRPGTAAEYRQAALAMLAEVGFPEPARIHDAYPHELSGGQRQRVVLAQALVCRPVLLLADEPTASLDSVTRAEIGAVLTSLQAHLGLGLVMASHDLGVLATLTRRLLVMHAGTIVETGSPAQVFGRPSHAFTRGLVQAFPRPPRTIAASGAS